MNRIILLSTSLLITLSAGSAARGQGCATTLQAHFSAYHAASISGSTIYTAVSVQGYASVTPSPGCNMNSATHKVGAYNTISRTGGWTYSPSSCPNCYYSVTSNEQMVGVPGVVYPWSWDGAAICSIVGNFWGNSGSVNLVDVSAQISQRNSSAQTPSNDDSAGPNYESATGVMNLGNFTNIGTFKGCGIGYETIGSITPSNYTGTVTINRIVSSDKVYTNTTEITADEEPPGYNDTSSVVYQDQNPQSGGSAGKVYDLDAPGEHPPAIDGNVYRLRVNFYTYAALPDGTIISPNYNFFVRISCQLLGPGYVFVNDVPGDNQIGMGTTNTTWNLQ